MIHLRNLVQPDLVLGGNVLSLSLEQLQRQGIAGLILDVDDTLVSMHSRQISVELRQWIETLRPQLQICW